MQTCPHAVVLHSVTWRLWEEVDDGAAAAPLPYPRAAFDFTVMSYNVLAQDLLEAHEELYTHCPLEVLEWSYRCSLLLEEIQKWAPDVSKISHSPFSGQFRLTSR